MFGPKSDQEPKDWHASLFRRISIAPALFIVTHFSQFYYYYVLTAKVSESGVTFT